MSNRSRRAEIARETVGILQAGGYVLPEGRDVSIRHQLEAAVAGTIVYAPSDDTGLSTKRDLQRHTDDRTALRCDVSNETTLSAARRLVQEEGRTDVLCLNFASAKNPGGGFLGGAQAQEESLARASGLFACLQAAQPYYDANRRCGTALYTHHVVYSPGVPVFRDDADELLATPYAVAILTVPAVNAGAVRRNEPEKIAQIEPVMQERMQRTLTVAAVHGHKTLVLGAWGCGVFRNDPSKVAEWFWQELCESRTFQGLFERVAFAVLDREGKEATIGPFRERLGPSGIRLQ
jgi:uncharacterized protein (TIGR02452 family)